MTLNLDDIARLAGVSRTTVSRVINDRPEVNEDTRRAVLKVIEEVKFHPNIAARMLATQRNRIISVTVCNPIRIFKSDYGALLFDGISDVTNERDYAMLLYWEESHAEIERFRQRFLQKNRLMDGVLLASSEIDSPLIDHLVELKIPFVMMERPTRHEDQISYVTIDNVASSKTVIDHLIGLGRRHIGFIVGLPHQIDAQARLKGYHMGLQEHDIPFEPRLVVEGAFTREKGYAAMKQLLARGVELDAVYVWHDDGAEGVLAALRDHGVRVPDDIAVVGFDDLPNAQHCSPSLTTIHQPIREKGVRATALLLDIIEGVAEGPQHILLPTHLVVRQSCGA